MATDKPTVNRRTLLGAAAALPAIAALSAPALATVATNRAAWDRAFAVMSKAKAAYAADDKRWLAIDAAYSAGRPSMDIIDWKQFPYENRDKVARIIDVEKRWSDFLAAEGKAWGSRDPAATKARMRAALDSILEFRRLEAENEARHDYNAATDRNERLLDALSDAEDVLLRMPAPDGEAFLWKLNRLFGPDARTKDGFAEGWTFDWIDPLMADAQRLLRSGRA